MKKVSKVFVVVMAMILTLAMGISAFAADSTPAVKKFGKVSYNKTMYTNGEGTYEMKFAYTYVTSEAPALLVTSSDRSILRITKIENDAKAGVVTVSVKALKNGKATVTVADQRNKKKAKKVSVTVKTLQSAVAFGGNVTVGTNDKGVMTATITVDKKGKADLGTVLTGDATGKKVKYEAASSADKKIASISAKGVVTAKSVAGTATYNVKANDTKENKDNVLAIVTINVTDKAAVAAKPVITDGKKIDLKSNLAAKNHTKKLTITGADVKDLVFTSSKPGVATVNEEGLVTAKANGKTVITVASKTNSKLAAKITVNVTTDVDVVTTAFDTATIVADGKSTLNILGATNKGASNAKVTYNFINGDNRVKSIKGVTVSSKGVVKVKAKNDVKNGMFQVEVTDKSKKFSQVVTINVVPATGKTTAVVVKNGTSTVNKKATAEIIGNGFETVTYTVETTGNDAAGVIWTNSNTAVADIYAADNGKTLTVTAKSAGKTKLVATANDGSKKKSVITLTVNSRNEATGTVTLYAKEKVTLDGSWTVADKTVAKFSKGVLTGVKVGKTQIKKADGTVYDVYVGPKPADVQKNVNKIITDTLKAENRDWMGVNVTFNAKTNAVNATILDADQDVKELRYTGASSYAPYFLTEANKNDYMPKAIKVEQGNGTVTTLEATKESVKATTNADGKAITVEAVKTSPTTATIKENETAYPAVTEWTVSGVEFDKIIDKLATKDLDVIKGLYENKTDYVNGLTVQKANDEPYTYEKVDNVLVVKHGAEVIFSETITDGTANRAADAVKKDASISVDTSFDKETTLRAFIGKDAKVTVTMQVNHVDYNFVYDVKTTMAAADYDSLVDADIQEVLDVVANAGADAATGIGSVTYDAAKNTFEVVADADMSIKDSYAELQKKVDALVAAVNDSDVTKTFNDLQKVVASVNVANKGNNYEKNRNGITIDEFIKDFADTYYAEVAKRADSYADLNGAVSGFYATFNVGNTTYTQYYEVRFVLSDEAEKAAFDKQVDADIEGIFEEAKKDAAFQAVGDADYDAAANTVNVTFKEDKTLVEYKDSAMFNTLKAAVKKLGYDKNAAKSAVVVNGKATDIKLASAEDMAKVVFDAVNAEGKKVSDLAKDDIKFVVTYTTKEGAFTLEYKFVAALANETVAKDAEAVDEVSADEVSADEVNTDTVSADEVSADSVSIDAVIEEAAEDVEAVDAATEDVVEFEAE